MQMDSPFTPGKDSESRYREALGAFATGVTVVTAPTATGPIGMTANSFSSISLDPPLVLWCTAKTSQRYPHFADSEHFSIHVLRRDQEAIAKAFANRGDAFDLLPTDENHFGVPVFDDCLARFDCTRSAIHEGGDHVIIVGKVERVLSNPGEPLVFARRSFGDYTPFL